MANKYFLGIDQGTTGTTSLVFNADWQICGRGYLEHTQIYPRPGWVEHDPMEIWQKTVASAKTALQDAGISAGALNAIGIDNQGETCMVWDRNTGMPVYNAIVWQDRRTAEQADRLRAQHGDAIQRKTGLQVDAYFSALKIKWILDNVTDGWGKVEKGELLVGTLDTWLLWKFTGGQIYATDPSTASRTMLYNLHDKKWDNEILEWIGLPESIWPDIIDSVSVFGRTASGIFGNESIPIAGSFVDQAAALFGQVCFEKGTVKTTYGTGCFMLMNTGQNAIHSSNGLVTTVVWSLDNQLTYALDGGVYITGAAVQWLRDGINIIDNATETESLAESVQDSGGLYFVPAFVGLAAPYWDQYARGMMIGLTAGTTRAHIVRATLEAIAFQVAENLDVMRSDSGMPIDVMRVDGGAVVNRFLMQFQADLLGIPVDVPVINETTALGAAFLAALGVGEFSGLHEIAEKWQLSKRYEPGLSEDERISLMSGWRKAVERSRNWDV